MTNPTPIRPVINPPAPSKVAPVVNYSFRTLDELSLDGPIRALIYGPPKVGKTELLLTFPNVAVADFDGDGVKVALNKGFQTRHGNVSSSVRFQSFADKTDPTTGLFTAATAFKESLGWISQSINQDWTSTLGLDSLTSMSIYARNAALVAADKTGKSQTLKNSKRDGILLMAIQDFGGEMGALEQLLDQLMVVKNKHVIVLAHERIETTDSGMVISKSPLITGDRLRAQLAKWFDEVWHLDADATGKRILTCQPKGVLKSVGSRLGLPQTIENPTYTKIMQELKGAK